jgi:hypothetical protein
VVTAEQGSSRHVTSTDVEGGFRFPDLADGEWTITIEMRGFALLGRTFAIDEGTPSSTWELELLSFEDITRRGSSSTGIRTQDVPLAGLETGPAVGFERAAVTETTPGPVLPGLDPDDGQAAAAADGFLINGSVNNSAASPFAQPAAFGNNRRRPGALYSAIVGALANTSAWDARPFSLTGVGAPRPDYSNVHVLATFAGPVKLPRLRNRLNVFAGYQQTRDDTAIAETALMPTSLERSGDFSQSLDAFGRPIQIVDPATGRPFPGSVIASDRISPQAAALLGYYPLPRHDATAGYNYEASILAAERQDSVQSRVIQIIDTRNQLSGMFAYQRTARESTTVFLFRDETTGSNADAQVAWSHRFSLLASARLRYQFTRQQSATTPYFAHRTNVSGAAGIAGNNQEPVNWGPPALSFSSGIAGLADALPRQSRTLTNAAGGDLFLNRGRHSLTIGGDVRRHDIEFFGQQDPRGSLTFTGAVTGSDFADFLLGIPSTSQIAFGNADKYFGGFSYDAYVTDDWRAGPSLTVTAGVRWEYESPLSERYGRLVNLDIASGFASVSPVLATSPIGSLTGRSFHPSLVSPDWSGVQPRLAVAWRPLAGSSLVIRAGYGVYRNSGAYQSIALLMAQQPPLSTTVSIAHSLSHPLTLARFTAPAGATHNTFAVDPDFRVGSAHNWQLSLQRDLPASLTVNASYLGTRGTGLIQQFLPNTYPAGAATACVTCPSGFAYLASSGSSSRHAGQFQVRRRLRGGFTSTVQYTISKAVDDAASYAGASLTGGAFAQNWLDLDAERARSAFDQRHVLTVQIEYTTGVGVAGGALIDGWRGALLKGWTITSQLTAGSGLPLTPYALLPTPGTGFTGAIRASLTGAPTRAPDGYYLNPEAYTVPDPGRWGNARRNSISGPADFQLNAGVTRTFGWGSRMNADWRIDATNVLNRVTYANVNTLVGSAQFGLPTTTRPMRRVQTSLRVRF